MGKLCSIMQRSNIGSLVREFLEVEGINQVELAKRALVSQSTVSRAIAGRSVRQGAARRKLFSYMQEQAKAAMPQPVSRAFRRVWDGSEAHAAALARIIEATESLRPSPPDGGKSP